MTKNDFIAALMYYYPATNDLLKQHNTLPSVMDCAVEYFWVNETPNDVFIDYFREKYKEMRSTGKMNFDGEN